MIQRSSKVNFYFYFYTIYPRSTRLTSWAGFGNDFSLQQIKRRIR